MKSKRIKSFLIQTAIYAAAATAFFLIFFRSQL